MRASFLVAFIAGCGGVPSGSDAGPPLDAGAELDAGAQAHVDGGIPASLADLQALVRSGQYLTWPAEAAAHPSAGPHGGLVRTFVNPLLRDSLKASAAQHPIGSIVVKELSNAGAITGYAVDAKRSDGQWLFLEGFLPGLNQYFFVGTGNLCGTCHRAGVDFVLTPAAAIP
jgi:hypothetical protein